MNFIYGEKHICTVCGKRLTNLQIQKANEGILSSKDKFCFHSKACKDKFEKYSYRYIVRCATCNKEFGLGKQKESHILYYCCRKCKTLSLKEDHSIPFKFRNCYECGKEFKSYNSRKWCTETCEKSFNKKKQKEAIENFNVSIIKYRREFRGNIYFIQSNNTGPIKIGFSEKPDKRISGIRGEHPYTITTLLVISHVIEEDEGKLHSYFKEYNIKGEWFQPEVVLDFIEKIKQDKKILDDILLKS